MYIELIENLHQFTESDLVREFNLLPPFRKQKVMKFSRFNDRLTSTLAYNLLTSILKKQFNLKQIPPFSFNICGKPFLCDYPDIHFNISHTNNAVAVAVDNSPVGLDVEEIKPLDNDIIKFVCSEQEIKQIRSSNCPETEFTKIWTQKEALLKFHGLALPNSNTLKTTLKNHTLNQPPYLSTFVFPNYILSVASSTDYPIKYPALNVKKS